MSVLPALTELGTLTHASGARPMPDGPVFWDNKAMDGPESGARHGAVACEFRVNNDHFFSVSIFMQCLYFRSLTVRPSAKACFSNSDSDPGVTAMSHPELKTHAAGTVTSRPRQSLKNKQKLNLTEVKWL